MQLRRRHREQAISSGHEAYGQPRPPVGAGLLAKAASQSMKMLNVLASSRASQLPQKDSGCTRILCPLKIQCGRACSR
ncbi:hypothetical protein SAMN03159391_00838 [Pseudomonas sp. NFACC37-1]|nr:hypothetical protein SAMN03159391_00838 [Pseudomonas sp. NFACC37-1]